MSLQGTLSSSSAAQLQQKKRRCAEVCVELLIIETVRMFSERESGPPPPATLEAIGFRVGRQLAERYTKDKPRLGDTLEVIKFICKEFWQATFKKQVDNLKTNHRGIYVLQDNTFRWLQHIVPSSGDSAQQESIKSLAQLYLHLPCGILRGALVHLGVHCTVEADPKALPGCSFTVRMTT